MHVVFIVGSYFPYYSAVSKCVGNVADELVKQNQITIICLKSFNEQETVEIYNNQKIIRVDTKENIIRNKLKKSIDHEKGLKKKIYQFFLNLYKTLRYVSTIFSRETIKKELVTAYYKVLCEIYEPIDLIVPSSMPFESVLAASKYNNDTNIKTKIIPYLFDQFVDSDTLHRNYINKLIKRRRNLSLERKTLSNAYTILAMHSLSKHFSNDLPEIKNIFYIEHPLLIKIDNMKQKNNRDVLISYIGGLYKNYVVPNYLLKLYQKSNINEITLHFYIIGNCFNIVNKYSRIMPDKIINHGSVDKQTANKAIIQSDILISIAEKKGIQMSSKIFEYISNGKPIIHFYKVDNDVNLNILNKYPLSLCLKQELDKLDENVNKFDKFCENNSNSLLSFKAVEMIYTDATPKYTADLIIQLITKDFT